MVKKVDVIGNATNDVTNNNELGTNDDTDGTMRNDSGK